MRTPALLTIVVLLLASLTACDASESEPDGALFTVRACEGSEAVPEGDTFRVRIRDSDVIEEAERLIESDDERILNAPLRRGDGGFNAPWSWHLDPDEVTFADMTTEVCDGCPHMIEEDLDYWVDTVGRYCPWSTDVIERVE